MPFSSFFFFFLEYKRWKCIKLDYFKRPFVRTCLRKLSSLLIIKKLFLIFLFKEKKFKITEEKQYQTVLVLIRVGAFKIKYIKQNTLIKLFGWSRSRFGSSIYMGPTGPTRRSDTVIGSKARQEIRTFLLNLLYYGRGADEPTNTSKFQKTKRNVGGFFSHDLSSSGGKKRTRV